MKGVLFTGITGELGRALIKDLSGADLDITCFIRKDTASYGMNFENIRVLKADITDRESIFRHAGKMKGRIDTLVHLAAGRGGESEKELHKTIVRASADMYDFANAIGCPKYVFFSSILAAGWVPGNMEYIDEGFVPPERNLCSLGRAKLKAEKELLGRSKKNDTKLIILRPGNIYGPPTKASFIGFIAEILKRQDRVFYHRAKNSKMWAPIHIKDVIACVLSLINMEHFNNEVYFLTGRESPSLEELTGLIAPLLGLSMDSLRLGAFDKIGFTARRKVDHLRAVCGRPSFPDYVYSCGKIRNDLGFSPQVGLAEGLPETVRWAVEEGRICV